MRDLAADGIPPTASLSEELEVGGHVRQNILTTMTSVSRMLDERMGTEGALDPLSPSTPCGGEV